MDDRSFRSETQICPACTKPAMKPFFRMSNVPVFCNKLSSERSQALAIPKGDINLGVCSACGFIYNNAFDPLLTQYCPSYENSLHFSPRFRRYAESLAKRLIRQHGLLGKTVIEIGCGQGDFLGLLAGNGVSACYGFDPSYDATQTTVLSDSTITVYHDYYSDKYMTHPADLVCCRHVLEHIAHPLDFMLNVRRALKNRTQTAVLFEVPNGVFALGASVWDIIYEHCSYFTEHSLAALFVKAEFAPFEITTPFEGQFLTIQAYPATTGSAPIATPPAARQYPNLSLQLKSKYDTCLKYWKANLKQFRQEGKTAVIWGAGSKGVQFLNCLNLSFRELEHVIDVNPRKHGKYIAGTGQLIVPPDALVRNPPDVAIVMNPIYEEEISQMLAELGVKTQVMLIEPPKSEKPVELSATASVD